MPRSGSRPGGKRRPQRDRRPGRAGTGPGPAYRPTSTGGGTNCPSSCGSQEIVKAVYLTALIPLTAVLSVVGYFGYHLVGS